MSRARRSVGVVGTLEDPFFQGAAYQGIAVVLLRAGRHLREFPEPAALDHV
jgi:hypothetical protein